ncbi:MAG: hypothetical protein ACQCN5_08550 [Candidatus Bathyarchaeia archaeon]|jgi:hypothetical protein
MSDDKPKKFEFMLLEAIDEALNTLGESVKKSVYFHLETTYEIKRHQIPSKISEFSNALDKMFGLGARYIEILIMKKFYPKIQITCNWQGPEYIIPTLSFKEYIELIRKEYCKVKIKGQIEFLIATNQEYVSTIKKHVPNHV